MPHHLRIVLLWLCTALFLARVFGQILVGICPPPQLPAWQEWYSGMLPYPWLLLGQLLLLMFMAVVTTDHARGTGRYHVTGETTRRWLCRLALVYALAMLLRYVGRMTVVPEARWFGGTLPIIFHCVLAAWLGMLAVRSTTAGRGRSK